MDKLLIEGGRPLSGEVAISGAKNAAHLAARILALSDSRLSAAVEDHKDRQRTKVLNTKVSA